jgi:sigma-B regulation protein RsbU (phosphoserine phosphatase)
MNLWPQVGAAVYLTVAFVLFILGVMTFRHAGETRVGRYAAWTILFAALGAFSAGVAMAVTSEYGSLPSLFHRLGGVWELFFPTLLGLSLLYPKEHRLSLYLPRLLPWLYAPYVFHLLVVALLPSTIEIPPWEMAWARGILAPIRILIILGSAGAETLLRFHAYTFEVVNLVFSAAALFFLARGYAQQLDPKIRQEGRLLVPGLVLSVGTYALAFLLPRLLPLPLAPWLRHVLLLLALLLGASAWAWTVIRYQFLGVRLIVRRGLVYSLSLGVIAAAYLIAYSQLQRLALTALGHVAPALHLLFLMLAVFLFQPLVQALESVMERLFAREWLDAQEILQRLGEQSLAALEPKDLEVQLREALETKLGWGRAYLLVEDPQRGLLVSTSSPEAQWQWGGSWRAVIRALQTPIDLGELRQELRDERLLVGSGLSEKALLVPVRHREEMLGVIILDPGSGGALRGEEVGLLASLARHVAVSLENAHLLRDSLEKRKIQEELAVAKQIQKQLLPAFTPQLPGVEIAALNIPSAEVGGDVYDFVEFDQDCLGVALGDVAGKGVPAALLMANIQSAFRVLASQRRSPAEVLSILNRHLVQRTSRDRYVTFFFGILDRRQGSLVYGNAGHNYPLVRHPGGEVVSLSHSDLVLGVMENAVYVDQLVQLQPGSAVLLYTDGVTEVFSPEGEEYGDERLKELLALWDGDSVFQLRDEILNAIRRFGEKSRGFDDITMIIVKLR